MYETFLLHYNIYCLHIFILFIWTDISLTTHVCFVQHWSNLCLLVLSKIKIISNKTKFKARQRHNFYTYKWMLRSKDQKEKSFIYWGTLYYVGYKNTRRLCFFCCFFSFFKSSHNFAYIPPPTQFGRKTI